MGVHGQRNGAGGATSGAKAAFDGRGNVLGKSRWRACRKAPCSVPFVSFSRAPRVSASLKKLREGGGVGATGTQGGSAVLAEVLTDQAGGGEQAWGGRKGASRWEPFSSERSTWGGIGRGEVKPQEGEEMKWGLRRSP